MAPLSLWKPYNSFYQLSIRSSLTLATHICAPVASRRPRTPTALRASRFFVIERKDREPIAQARQQQQRKQCLSRMLNAQKTGNYLMIYAKTENTKVSERCARRWMRFAENSETLLAKSATVADFTFAEADRLLAAVGQPTAPVISPDATKAEEPAAPKQKAQWSLPANASGGVRALAQYRGVLLSDDGATQVAANPVAHLHEKPVTSKLAERSLVNVTEAKDESRSDITGDLSISPDSSSYDNRIYRGLRAHLEGCGPRPSLPSRDAIEAMTVNERATLRRFSICSVRQMPDASGDGRHVQRSTSHGYALGEMLCPAPGVPSCFSGGFGRKFALCEHFA